MLHEFYDILVSMGTSTCVKVVGSVVGVFSSSCGKILWFGNPVLDMPFVLGNGYSIAIVTIIMAVYESILNYLICIL